MDRRIALQRALGLGGGLAATALARPARAQSSQPIRIVTGFAAGGAVDLIARLVGEQLTAALGRPAIVENRTGAAGRLAVEAVKAAPPDGDTLLVVPQGPMTLFTHVFRTLRFDPNRDFVPVTRLCTGDVAISTGPMTGTRDLAALVSWLRAAGPKATYGSSGSGTILHFTGVSLAKAIGVPMTHVPYRGAALSITDLAGGAIATAVTTVTEAMEMHASGRVRIVATASTQRTPFLQGVPTLGEAGIDVEVPMWYGLYAPAGTPPTQVERLQGVIATGLATPSAKERLDRLGMVAAPTTSAQLLALQTRESQMWGPIVRASGFTPED